LWDGNC